MSCNDSTANNRPVGVGYNSRSKPTSLVELTHISVSSIYTASTVNTASIIPVGNTLVVYGYVSAVGYIGASGSGVTALSALSDVSITNPTNTQVLAYNGTSWVPSSLPSIGGVTDHGALTGLADDDHPQYTLSATNATLSSVVASHNSDVTTHFYASSLSSNPGYVLSSTNATLSSVVSTHNSDSTTHFYASSLSSNPGYLLSSYAATIYQPLDPTLTAMANTPTAANTLIYFSGVDLAASALFTSAGRKFAACSSVLAAGDLFYYDGASIVKLAAATKDAVLTMALDGTLQWVDTNVEGSVLTYSGGALTFAGP
jgi:hypothetical protein